MKFICNLCQATSFKARFKISDSTIVACSSCGLLSYHPIPTEYELSNIYESEAYFEKDYFKVDDEEVNSTHYRHFVEVADLASRHCNSGEKLLEIGPGQGLFLKMCLDRGVHAEALEFSSQAANEIRERLGCQVYQGTLERAAFAPQSYRMVVSFDVIEHCTDPMGWLKSINKLLKPGGVLALSTLSVENLLDKTGAMLYKLGLKGFVEKLYPKYHLYYFTPDTLNEYLVKAGFSVDTLVQENYDYRKATSKILEQLVLRSIYSFHNLSGNKTNVYVKAIKQ